MVVTIGFRLVAVVVLAALVAPASFAKEGRAGGGKRAAGAAVSKSAPRNGTKTTTQPQAAKHVPSEEEKGVEAPAKEPPVADTASDKSQSRSPNAAISIKLKPPEKPHDAHTPSPPPPTTRNAIGVLVAPHRALLTSSSEHSQAVLAGTGHSGTGTGVNSGALPMPSQPQIVIDTAVAPVKIVGPGPALIRPRSAPLGLAVVGGPAKPPAAINGTTIRPKR
jgi:hypothetical protein